jgi:hypothetical protein
MALPKIDLPTYEMKLPSTGERVAFRPFLVKEEKILMMAMESNEEAQILRSIKQIINNCLVEGNLDVDKLPMFDIEYFFLRLRAKSIGETIDVTVMHPMGTNKKGETCIGQAKLQINVDDINVTMPENASNTIMLTDDVGLVMKYATTDDLTKAQKKKTEFDILISLMKSCVEQIFDNDEVTSSSDVSDKELEEFLMTLNTEQFKKISAFFESTPKVEHEVEWTCPECGEVASTKLAGLDDFFG